MTARPTGASGVEAADIKIAQDMEVRAEVTQVEEVALSTDQAAEAVGADPLTQEPIKTIPPVPTKVMAVLS